MFTSIWSALLVTGVFTILLFLARHQAFERGNHDGWFEAMDELRVNYVNSYYDGFDDACTIKRNEYHHGFDDGWWEGNNDAQLFGEQLGYERGYTDGRAVTAEVFAQVGGIDQYAIEVKRSHDSDENGLAGSSDEDRDAAERLFEALAEMSEEVDEILRRMTKTVQYAMREGFKQGWDAAYKRARIPASDDNHRIRDSLADELAATIKDTT